MKIRHVSKLSAPIVTHFFRAGHAPTAATKQWMLLGGGQYRAPNGTVWTAAQLKSPTFTAETGLVPSPAVRADVRKR